MIQAFTKLCDSVYPWQRVSEIQIIVETSSAVVKLTPLLCFPAAGQH